MAASLLLQPKPLLPLLLLLVVLLLLLQGCWADGEGAERPQPKIGEILDGPDPLDGRRPLRHAVSVRYSRSALRLRCRLSGQFYAWVHGNVVVGLQRELVVDPRVDKSVLDSSGYLCIVCAQPSCDEFISQSFHVIQKPEYDKVTAEVTLDSQQTRYTCRCPSGVVWMMYNETHGKMMEKGFDGQDLKWSERSGTSELTVTDDMLRGTRTPRADVTYFSCRLPNGTWHKHFRVTSRFIIYDRKQTAEATILMYNVQVSKALTDEAAVPEEVAFGSTVTLSCEYPGRNGAAVSWEFRQNGSDLYRSLQDGAQSGQFSVDGEKLTVTFFNGTTIGFYRCVYQDSNRKWVILYKRLLPTRRGSAGYVHSDSCKMNSKGQADVYCYLPPEAMRSNLTWVITPTGQREPFQLLQGQSKGGFESRRLGRYDSKITLRVRDGRGYHGCKVQCLVNGYGLSSSTCTLTLTKAPEDSQR